MDRPGVTKVTGLTLNALIRPQCIAFVKASALLCAALHLSVFHEASLLCCIDQLLDV